MSTLKKAVADIAWLQNEVLREPDLWEMHYRKFIPALESAARADPEGVWHIFKNGTDEEFAAIVNFMDSIGRTFESDEAHREIMRLAKMRGTPLVLEETKSGFGALFDRFWSETETVSKAQTFDQIKKQVGTA